MIFGAVMDAVTCNELKTEQALAKRWLRTDVVPLSVWKWLAGREVSLCDRHNNLLPPASPLLLQSLNSFAEPLGSHSNDAERRGLNNCLATVGQLLMLCHQSARGPALACQQRLLAASLLPLYRGLARGSVAEVTSVLRRQLADAVTLHAALIEFPEELPELLSGAMADEQSPYAKFQSVFQAELELLAQTLLVAANKWEGRDPEQLGAAIRDEVKIDWRPAWGQPTVLWRLAGELIAKRAEFVVPRDWIDVPVPWNEASEHWLDIVHALEQSPAASSNSFASASADQATTASSSRLDADQQVPSMETQPAHLRRSTNHSSVSRRQSLRG